MTIDDDVGNNVNCFDHANFILDQGAIFMTVIETMMVMRMIMMIFTMTYNEKCNLKHKCDNVISLCFENASTPREPELGETTCSRCQFAYFAY